MTEILKKVAGLRYCIESGIFRGTGQSLFSSWIVLDVYYNQTLGK